MCVKKSATNSISPTYLTFANYPVIITDASWYSGHINSMIYVSINVVISVELLLARTLTAVNAKPISAIMPRTVSASGLDWGVLAAAGVLTIVPGALGIWFVGNHIAKGSGLGRV
jgi:hypothetical protein